MLTTWLNIFKQNRQLHTIFFLFSHSYVKELTMNRKASKFVLFLSMVFVLYACNQESIYDEQIKINHSSWYKDEAARFDVIVSDTLQPYDFYLNIRNSTDYRYSNLYVFLITKFPNNNLTKDTIECILADREGRWLGKGWGAVKENTILLSERMRFPLKGKYEFMIQHAMRVDTLKGIRDVGIRIVKSE